MNQEKKPVKPLPFSVVKILNSPLEAEFAFTCHPPEHITLTSSECYIIVCSLDKKGVFDKILTMRKEPLSEIEEIRPHNDITPQDNQIFVDACRRMRRKEPACA